MMYFNLDYLERPKSFVNELVQKVLHGIKNIVVYALKRNSNFISNNKKRFDIVSKTMRKNRNSTASYNCLFGLGSIFYFNKLKNLSLKDKDVEMIELKNIIYLERESKRKN